MKKLFVALFVASCLLAASMPAFAGTVKNWELVYDHDATGKAISGSLVDLVNAIRSGADVQIVAHGPLADVLLKSQHIRVENGGALVVASISDNTWNDAKTDVYLRIMLFRTDGTREILYQQASGKVTDYANIPMTWYVNR
jgi:hypothetical protein